MESGTALTNSPALLFNLKRERDVHNPRWWVQVKEQLFKGPALNFLCDLSFQYSAGVFDFFALSADKALICIAKKIQRELLKSS